MMSHDFPILKLPLTMQAAMIQNLGGAEALKIATNNPDFRQMLSVHKLQATSLYYNWSNYCSDSGRTCIEVNFGENQNKLWIRVAYGTPWTLETGTEKRLTPLEIGDIVFELKEFKDKNQPVICLDSDRIVSGVTELDVLEMYSSYLMELIKVEKVRVCGQFSEENDFIKCFLWKRHGVFSNIHAVLVNDELIHPDNFKFFHEQLVAEKCKLQFFGDTLEENLSSYTTPITIPDVTLNEADFLHPDAILNSTSSFINLHDLPYSYSFMNAVVKTWIHGGLANLQRMRISCGYWQKLVKDEKFLDGIPATERDSEEDPKAHFDVRRLTDGAQATISFDYKKEFEFLIQKPLEN